jgi:ABC-type lipoprotein export system ATPase subunit
MIQIDAATITYALGSGAETEREIMDLFGEIQATGELTVLMITHAPHLVPQASRVVEMAGEPGASGGVLRAEG